MVVVFRNSIPIKCLNLILYSFKRYSSQTKVLTNLANAENNLPTLFVPGRNATYVYQIVKPVIDADYISNNLGKIKLSCDLRGLQLDIDYIVKLATEWSHLKTSHASFVAKERCETEELESLKNANRNADIPILEGKRKETIKSIVTMKEKIYDIEDILMPLMQKLPHILDPVTPLQLSVVDVYQNPPDLCKESKSHVEISEKASLLTFTTDTLQSYYMTGKIAELELLVQSYFTEKFLNCQFYLLSCIDFCKSFIIEALGFDPHTDSIVVKGKTDKELGQKLHLVGGSSFEAFCVYFTNMNANKSTLPLKYLSVGRRYDASKRHAKISSLYSVVQSSNIHSAVVSEPGNSKSEFDLLVNVLLSCYSELNIPYRTVEMAASSLTLTESRRKQFELWSPAIQDFIPVAYVSQHDDFVSKRLNITFGKEYATEGYCSIVEGVVVNIPVLIGCIIENYQTDDHDFDFPATLKSFLV